jgi:cyanophycin synthetase
VVGDGVHTVAQLIDRKNNDPERANRHADSLSVIDLDSAIRFLGEQRMAEVLEPGKKLDVLGTSNIGMGGEAEDVTDTVHPTFKEAAVRITTALDMFLSGVDFLATDLTKPLVKENGILLEINATPGLRMHQHPAHGTPRDVAGAIMDAFSAKIAGTKS